MDFKGSQFERDIILWGVRWYVAYPISYRQLEEMMQERGVEVDHSSLNRWVLKFTPLLEQAFQLPVADGIRYIPTHTPKDNLPLKLAALEIHDCCFAI